LTTKLEKKRNRKKRKKKKKKGGKEGGGREKKKEEGEWVYRGRGAWVLRRVGPHTNNARST